MFEAAINRLSIKEIKVFLQVNKVDIAVLVETRVKKEKSQKILGKICSGWESCQNYSSAINGRIWCCWNPRTVRVTYLEEHEQALHCEVLDVSTGRGQHLIALYAQYTHEQRKHLWGFLKRMIPHIHQPLLIGGDFNVVFIVSDQFQGNIVTESVIIGFQQCIQQMSWWRSELLAHSTHGQTIRKGSIESILILIECLLILNGYLSTLL